MPVQEGLITKIYGAYFTIYSEGVRFQATLRGKFRNRKEMLKNPVAVGDRVMIQPGSELENGYQGASIDEILPRKNKMGRAFLDGRGVQEHILAANLDQVCVVNSIMNPDLKTGFIDRVLVGAGFEGIAPVIIINKADLAGEHLEELIGLEYEVYTGLDIPVFVVSALHSPSTEDLRAQFENKISLLIGYSGVGKSTLINSLFGKELQKTKTVSQSTFKGKHTTTNPELVPFAKGGWIIDTPGIREFGLHWIDPADVSYYFPEFRELQSECRFGNKCFHDHEPGCRVKLAAENEEIAYFRYDNYIRIINNLY